MRKRKFSAEGNLSQNKRKKRRGPQQTVCDRCRRLKEACDRNLPCLRCAHSNKECSYTSHSAAQQAVVDGNAEKSHHVALYGCRSTSNLSQVEWYDHLLDLLCRKRSKAQSMLHKLLDSSSLTIQPFHWFELVHIPRIKDALMRRETRSNIHPSLVFALIAVAARKPKGKLDNRYPRRSIIPQKMLSDDNMQIDISLQAQAYAKAYFATGMSSLHTQGALQQGSYLQLLQAAAILAVLENDFDLQQSFYIQFVMSFLLTSSHIAVASQNDLVSNTIRFQETPSGGWEKPDVKRSSIDVEELTRIQLLPLWWLSSQSEYNAVC